MAERNELWERWRRGETISDIGRALDRAPGTIFCTLTERGGVAPRPRRRSRLALTLPEREEISRGIAAGESARTIAARLGRIVKDFPPERLWVNPDCGLKTRGYREVQASLTNMVAAAAKVRAQLG